MQDNNNNNNEVSRAERFENAHKRRRRRNKIWFVLACIVVFCTTYALILPAITLERPTYCGLEEHTHDASCYERVLTCGMVESAEHQHTDACYTEVLTCGKTEHTHTDSCYVEPEQAAAKPDVASDEEPLPNDETPAANDDTPAANAEGEAISTAEELKSKLEAGGTYYLANDITISDKIEIPNGKTSVLNLNGHTVSYNSTASWYFILVRQGASLTINDDWTGTGAVTETSEYVTGTLYGRTASLTDNEDGSKTLVYYVTESTPSGTTTTERLAKHTVVITPPSQTAGGITSTAASTRDALVRTDGGTIVINGGTYTNASHLIKGNNGSSTNITINGGYFTQATGEALYLNGGTMTINGGVTTGNTDNTNGGAGVYVSDGTANIKGGFIIGNRAITEGGTLGNRGYGGGVGMDKGTLNISGGVIAGNTAVNSGGGIYVRNNGTSRLDISGGYIAGNSASNGGGINIAGGTFNISGNAVIAANSCPNNGGGIYMGNGTLSISGGAIAGNVVTGQEDGGGIYKSGGTLSISGGYVTNNKVTNIKNRPGYGSNGGGGICMNDGTVNVSGGYVTGNYSENVGGGLFQRQRQFNMTGGTFASNCANQGEGGAMRLCSWDGSNTLLTGKINAAEGKNIYITNNITNTTFSWGGGGIFVAEGGVLGLSDTIVTGNHSGGFGGGVSGCSTGRTYVFWDPEHDDGAAIYGNSADGVNTTPRTDDNKKPDDNYAYQNAVFMESGYQDFFCAMNSVVYDNMLGGGSANWTGSCDYEPVTVEQGGSAVAGTMMGLTADPSGESISKALAKGTTFVSGNKSHNHGGGIMSNGVLLFGETKTLNVTPGLTIHGFKNFQVNGQIGAITDEQFTFLLIDKSKATYANGKLTYSDDAIVDTAKSTLDRDFLFSMVYDDETMAEDATKVYSYYLTEKAEPNNGITYDNTVYEINVTVQKTKGELKAPEGGNSKITVYYYLVTSAAVTNLKTNQTVNVSPQNLNNKNHSASISIGSDSNNATFFNTGEQPQFLRITKTDNFDHILNGVMFRMTDSNGNEVSPMSTLNGESRDGKMWYPTNRNGNLVYQVFGNRTYYLYEEPREGYEPAGPWVIEINGSADKAVVHRATEADGSITKGDLIKEVSLGSGDNAHYFDYGIVNTAIPYELPKTGGAGTTAMYSLGALLILAAAVGAGYDLRHRRERRKH